MARSPDSDWSDPRFAIRRLTRRPTVPLDAYQASPEATGWRATLRERALAARVPGGPEICLILGVMPRSGTNYAESLLLTHPNISGAPDDLRELPLLSAADRMDGFQDRLAEFYEPNAGVFAQHEWLAYAAAGYVNRLRNGAGSTTGAVLLKDPHMRHVWLFDVIFPAEKALLVLRDGRHVVDSTIRTWPLKFAGRTFEDVCLEWAAATTAALDYAERAPADRVRLVRYEALAEETAATVAPLMEWLSVDPAAVPEIELTDRPILGSSTHSKAADGTVGWTPVKADKDFNPARRKVDWDDKQHEIFDRICGAAQSRAGYGA